MTESAAMNPEIAMRGGVRVKDAALAVLRETRCHCGDPAAEITVDHRGHGSSAGLCARHGTRPTWTTAMARAALPKDVA
jgi:hypothetical protein